MRDEGREPKPDDLRGLPSRRDVLVAGAAVVTAPFIRTESAAAQAGQALALAAGRTMDWASYGGD
jgi:hypothetical protein